MSEKERQSGEAQRSEPVLPTVTQDVEKAAAPVKSTSREFHPAFYVAIWISLSSSIIIFNKYILHTAGFPYPITLTTWHLVFATIMTQLMARFTPLLDSRKKVPMTGRVYLRAIVPIGVMFSLSLICGNLTYLYLSVAFIQMLKATTPVAVLLAGWLFRIHPPNMKTLGNVSFIVIGVIIASFGEIQFVLAGFLYQLGGIVFEAIRLVMVESLLSSSEFKMDPLVSLYYFAPACAIMNFVIALIVEVPKLTLGQIEHVGYSVLLANAVVAFGLNVAVVFLIGRTSSLVMTLSGVLKDILLVFASMLIFRDPVTLLQAFGYSIALAGLVYYKLGGEKLKEHLFNGRRAWNEYGAKNPIAQRLLAIAGVVLVMLALVVVVSSSGVVPQQYDPWRKSMELLYAAQGQTNGQ